MRTCAKSRLASLLLALACCAVLAPDAAAAKVPNGSSLLKPATHATAIAFGPEGTLWLIESRSPGMDKPPRLSLKGVTDTGGLRSVALPGLFLQPLLAPTAGSTWVSTGGTISRFSSSGGRLGRFPLPRGHSSATGDGEAQVEGLAAAPDGSAWFTCSYYDGPHHHSELGRLGTAGELTTFPLGSAEPLGITYGSEGDLWFVDAGPSGRRPAIVRMTQTGAMTSFALPVPRRQDGYAETPVGEIVTGPDGDLWFAYGVARGKGTSRRARIARITPSGQITSFIVPGNRTVGDLTPGPSGDIWFKTHLSGAGHGWEIDSIAPDGRSGTPTCLPLGDRPCEIAPYALAAEPTGALWFSAGRLAENCGGGGSCELSQATIEGEAGYLGRFDPVPPAVRVQLVRTSG